MSLGLISGDFECMCIALMMPMAVPQAAWYISSKVRCTVLCCVSAIHINPELLGISS